MKCKVCGKERFDTSKGCKNPKVYSDKAGDWVCLDELGNKSKKAEKVKK